MDYRLLEIIACPVCHGRLQFDQENSQLICQHDALIFPIRDGIPVLLEQEGCVFTAREKSV